MKKPIIGVTPLFDRERDSYWMLPGYLEGLEQAGYGFVSLSEMLLEEPYTIDHEGRQRAL